MVELGKGGDVGWGSGGWHVDVDVSGFWRVWVIDGRRDVSVASYCKYGNGGGGEVGDPRRSGNGIIHHTVLVYPTPNGLTVF